MVIVQTKGWASPVIWIRVLTMSQLHYCTLIWKKSSTGSPTMEMCLVISCCLIFMSCCCYVWSYPSSNLIGPLCCQGDVWICMELMDTSLDKFYKQVHEKGMTIPEDILGKITVSVSTTWFSAFYTDLMLHVFIFNCMPTSWAFTIILTLCKSCRSVMSLMFYIPVTDRESIGSSPQQPVSDTQRWAAAQIQCRMFAL